MYSVILCPVDAKQQVEEEEYAAVFQEYQNHHELKCSVEVPRT